MENNLSKLMDSAKRKYSMNELVTAFIDELDWREQDKFIEELLQ